MFGNPDSRFTSVVEVLLSAVGGMRSVSYEIEVADQPAQAIAAVAWDTTGERFPREWRGHLDEVYACLRQAGVKGGCNVMVYRDLPEPGHIRAEVGVEVGAGFSPSGRVQLSALPAGPAAVTTHRGPYEGLGAAHAAVGRWCAAAGRTLTGQRWEVYGDWEEDPARLETRVCYGLASNV